MMHMMCVSNALGVCHNSVVSFGAICRLLQIGVGHKHMCQYFRVSSAALAHLLKHLLCLLMDPRYNNTVICSIHELMFRRDMYCNVTKNVQTCTLAGSASRAYTYYVNSETGQNWRDGRSPATAWKTLDQVHEPAGFDIGALHHSLQ